MFRNFTVRPPLQTSISTEQHASAGNGKAYPKEVRELILQRHLNGQPRADAGILQLQHQHKYPCNRTIRRWLNKYNTQGHVLPYRRTGNHRAERELRGTDMASLALIRALRPKARLYEVKAFVHSANPANTVYSDSQLFRAESKIGLTRKAASTTAEKAFLPINLAKRRNYFELNYPFGIADIDGRDVLDMDEMGLELEHQVRSFGKSAEGDRCSQKGAYNRNQKLNTLACISGDDQLASRWIETWTGEGTTTLRFSNFIRRVIGDLDQMYPNHERSFCFTMDNLNAHKNPQIINMILTSGHKIVYRAPYYAVDGAIEYVFNTIHTLLEVHYNQIHDMDELVHTVEQIFANLGSFVPYFEHVGFVY